MMKVNIYNHRLFYSVLLFLITFFCCNLNVLANEKYTFSYTGNYQVFEVPKDGTYKVQLWGAQGGNTLANNKVYANTGGFGAYTKGIIELKKGQKLYIYVGGMGANGIKRGFAAGGWNGGGNGNNDYSDDEAGGGGGGATDIRLVPTSETNIWNEFDSLKSRIMVAAGGGGSAEYVRGGAGGDLTSPAAGHAAGSTQTVGYAFGIGAPGVYRYSNKDEAGGGGGYYGGRVMSSSSDYNAPGVGGSSFISGYEGADAIAESSTSDAIVHTGQSVHYSGMSFQYGKMIRGDGTYNTPVGYYKIQMPTPSGTLYAESTGHTGNGYAIIEYLEEMTIDDYEYFNYNNAVFNFSYTGSYQTFIAPYSGTYKFEAWGARGGGGLQNSSVRYRGGYGAYAAGSIHLNKGDKIYVYVGQAGYNGRANCKYCGGYGGWNGGGQGGNDSNHDSAPDEGGGGGGATDFRLIPTSKTTTWNEFESLKSRILIAGAGSGSTYSRYGEDAAKVLNKTNGYALGLGQKGYAASSGSGGGGGGYFGGISNQCDGCQGYGGTSYVSGSTDDLALDVEKSTSATDTYLTSDSIHYSGLRFYDITKINGASVMPDYTGTSTMTGNNNNGYAKITILEVDNSHPRLTDIQVSGGTFGKVFDKNVFEYDVNVASENYNVDITATKEIEEHTIFKGVEKKTLNAGSNIHYIGVMSQTGEVALYRLNIYRQASSYPYLEDIKVDGVSIPDFDPSVLEYNVPLEAEQEVVDVEAIFGRPSQTVSGTGKVEVDFGTTTHEVVVVSEDNSNITTYKINFIKGNSSLLKSLNLEGYPLEPVFDPETYNYKIAVPNGVLSLDVDAVPYDKSAKVSIKGNGYLKSGQTNTITVTVTQETAGTSIYTVMVEREGVVATPVYNFSCTKTAQEFEAPGSGFYRIELWGAQGGIGHRNYQLTNRGGYGGYSAGTLWLGKGEKIYVYVGCKGANAASVSRYIGGLGGWNGGGQGGNDSNHDSAPDAAGGGGGATDIRLVSGTYNNFQSLKSRIMVAGGGSGSNYGRVGYPGNEFKNNENGYKLLQGQQGVPGTSGSQGGGGGYFGGISVQCDGCQGYGGTSYVSGGEGYLSITEDSTSSNVTLSENNVHYSGKVFTDIEVYNGNESMPSKTSGYTIGNTGDGAARITLLPYPSENNYLESITLKVNDEVVPYTPSINIDDLDYYASVEVNDTKITISARPEDSTASIEGLGIHDVKAGENIYPIVVTAENGDVRTYNMHVTRPASDNPYPEDIIISGLVPSLCSVNEEFCKLSPELFDKNTNNYILTVPSRIKQLWFNVEKGHDFQVVNGEGKVSLQGGENLLTITVTSEDGQNSTVYNYIVTRDMTGNTDLSILDLVHPARDLNYDPDVTEYYVSIPNSYTSILDITDENYDPETDEDISTARIKIETDDPNASYVISGNTDFQTGMNQMLVIVTAANGETKVYILNVYREKSSNTFIKNIMVKNGETEYPLTPEFNPLNTGTYNVTVPNDIDNIDLLAEPDVETTTIAGTGNKQLKTGNNLFELITTSENGETETYIVNIFRERNNNANLTNIKVSDSSKDYVLNPEFDKETIKYNTQVDVGVTTVTITATPEVDTTTYKLLDNNKIKIGDNIKRVMAIAEDGSTKTYTINIYRPASDNNNLADITTNVGTLTPEFDKDVTEYTIDVENEITSITINGIKEDPLATVKGNGKYALSVGDNEITLIVTSESGLTKTYLITVNRKPNSNAYLKSITTSEGVIVPAFDKTELKYTINVENNVESILINGTPEVKTTIVTGNGTYNLNSGSNVFTLTTLAEDKTTTLTYEIEVIRDLSENDNISSLIIEEGALTPKFESNVIAYDVVVPNEVTKGTFHVELEDEKATYEIIGNEDFVVGNNEVIVRVKSEAGLTKDYRINITRQEMEDNSSYLSNLTVSTGTLTPEFNKEKQFYTVEVPYNTSSMKVTATSEDSLATITGTGTYKLNVGDNLITVRVKSVDGKIRDYQILVTRLENDEARLSALKINGYVLNPLFDKDVYSYSITTSERQLPFTQITPIDPNATYEIIGNDFDFVGNHEVIIKVTAANKTTTKEYKIEVTKDPSNNNNLSNLFVVDHVMDPIFSKSVTLYNVVVANNENSITIEATAEDDKANITGTGSYNIDVGINTFIVEVTSESGVKKAYTIVVNKEGSSNNEVDTFIVNNGTMTPEYSNDVQTYSVEVPYEETSLDLSIKLADDNATYSIVDNKLDVGTNIVKVLVTAENGSVRTIVLNVKRNEIVSSLLEKLSIKSYVLTPSFNSNVLNYDVLVDNEITSLNLNIVPLDKNATYVVTGNENFVVGTNVVQIEVTSSNGVDKTTYVLNVNRQAYSNSYLDYFYTSEGDVTPLFDKNILDYSIDVPNDVDSIEFFGEPVDKSASVSGLTVHQLKTGENVIPVVVTTTSGIKRTYNITVNRTKDNNNNISSLIVKRGSTVYTLTPEFNKDTLSYSVTVPIGTPNVTIEATPEVETTKITGTGLKTVNPRANTFLIEATSEYGEVKTYELIVNREVSNNNYLTDLIPSVGELEPEFNYTKTDYTLNLDSGASLLSFEYSTEDPSAKVTGNEAIVVPDGLSTRTIEVEAEDGTKRIYTITVNKERTDNANLAQLYIKDYPFDVAFDKNTYEYHITVPNSKKVLLQSEVVATTEDPNAKLVKTSNLNLLTTQDNEFIVTVTAPDGFTKQSYKIIITREKSTEHTLSSLMVKQGFLTTSYKSDVYEYEWKIPKELDVVTTDFISYTTTDPNSVVTITPSSINMKQDEEKVFIIHVDSEDGSGYSEYKLLASYDLSSDTTLSSLEIDKGFYEPELDPENRKYDVYVYEDETDITISATTTSENSTITSGIGLVDLTGDIETHYIEVTAEDGTVELYELTINKTIKTDKGLKKLGLNGLDGLDCIEDKCILSPEFNTEKYKYSIRVPYEYTNLDLLVETMNSQQSYKLYVGEEEIKEYNLPVGTTEITIDVYDGMDKKTSTYTLSIERCKSNNTYLKSLSIEGYELDSTFDKTKMEYTVYVPKEIDEVTILAETEDPNSGKAINGYNYLQEGNNDATITVYAPDGSTRTYIVHIIKAPIHNSYIKNITVSTGIFWDLTPKFNQTTYEYTTTISSIYSKATVEAVPVSPDTTIIGTGEYELQTGSNVVTLVSTSADGSTVSIYKVNIIKEASSNVNLQTLIVEEGDLSPTFEKGQTKYTVNVDSEVNKLTIHAIPEDKTSNYMITGNENLQSGENKVNIIVMSEDKSISKTYQLTVVKAKSKQNKLSELKVRDDEKEYEFTPEFNSSISSYDIYVPSTTEKVYIEGTPISDATTINGVGEEYLDYGSNLKVVTVTAESGDVYTYTLNIYREYNLKLKDLINDYGDFTPKFTPDTLEYTLTVPNSKDEITFIAFAESNKVSVSGTGTYNLIPGENVFNFVVTSPDNHLLTYTVKVIREKDDNNYIKNLQVNGLINPSFDRDTEEYTVDIRKELDNLDLVIELESTKASYEVLGNSNFKDIDELNEVIIRVTAENGSTRDYVLNTYKRHDAYFSNRLLSLTINYGTLTPDFNPDVNNYAVTVPNSVSELLIETTKEDEYATVTGDGKVPLELGRNSIDIVVTSKEGRRNIYSLIVYRTESNDATLKSLTIQDINYQPIFNKLVTSYTVDIGSEYDKLNITAIPTDPNATVEITNNNFIPSGQSTININVTAPDNVTKMTYTLLVTKSLSKNNYLKDLNVTNFEFDKEFNKQNTGPYIINVDSHVNSINVNAIPDVNSSTVTGDGNIKLTTGKNLISVNVVSESGELRTYSIIVNKAEDTDSTLKDILLSDGDLDPEFDPAILDYEVVVPEEVESITITGITNSSNATIKGNGSYDILEKETIIPLTVTAEDGNVTIYNVKVIRNIETSSKLKNLIVKNGELYPGFHKLITSYTILVPNEVTTLDMLITPEDEEATYEVVGNDYLTLGSNVVLIRVTSKDGSNQTEYVLSVVRQTSASNFLRTLEVEGYTMFPEFDKMTLFYEVSVPIDIEQIKIKATAEDSTSIISGTGLKSVNPGENIFYVTVESASGCVRTYQILVRREESEENFLLELNHDVGIISPEFEPTINDYTITVPNKTTSITLSGKTSEKSEVTGFGTFDVSVGTMQKSICVTSQSGDTNIYKINIVRNANNSTELDSLTPSSGTLNYSNDKVIYDMEVEDDVTFMSFAAVTKDPDATVTGNDFTELNYGDNTIMITVTAEDGVTTRTITVNIYRKKALNSITVNPKEILIEKEEVVSITYTLDPIDTSYSDVEWISNDPDVATVDNNGNITGVKLGSTTVNVRSKHDNSIYASVIVNVINKKLINNTYSISRIEVVSPYIIGLEPKTKYSDFVQTFDNNLSTIHVYDIEGNEITNVDEFMGTSMVVKLIINDVEYDSLNIVVRGDLTGDGILNITDYNKLNSKLLRKVELTECESLAADTNSDAIINITDYNKLNSYLLKKVTTLN